MENWRAGLIGVGIVLIGFGGYSSLEGVWKGLSLVAAGIALVLLGLSLERRPREAGESAGDAVVEGADERSGDALDVTVPITAVSIEDDEATVPLVPIRASIEEDASEAAPEPEPEPEPEVEPEVADGSETQREVPPSEPEPRAEPEMLTEEGSGSNAEPALEVDETAHRHDQPMLGHSELVSHIRDYHEGVPFDGSTIQLRLLHERAHA